MNDRPVMVIVGGNRGIGAATARLASQRGYSVVLTYASGSDQADALVTQIAAAGGQATACHCDVTCEADIDALFEQAASQGTLRAVVYSSGITGAASSLAHSSAQTLRKVIEVNLIGAMLCARAAIRKMSTHAGGQGGWITFISPRASARKSNRA